MTLGNNHWMNFWRYFVLLCILHGVVLTISRNITKEKVVCKKGSLLADILAFEVVAGGCVLFLATSGCLGFWYNENESSYSSQEAFYRSNEYVEKWIIIPMMAYQTWNTLVCLIWNDIRDYNMILHHILVIIVSTIGLSPMMQLESSFFFGVTEISNIPLTLLDLFRYIPNLKERYNGIYDGLKITFAFIFLIIRVVIWPIISIKLWYGVYLLGIQGLLIDYWKIIILFASHGVLTFLQFFWGFKLIEALGRKLKRA